MKVAFRTDASLEIGTGHVMRCLTLADALRARGGECVFVCRPHRGHLLEQIRERGHEVRALSPPPASFGAQADDTPHAEWLGLGWARDAEETLRLTAGERVDWLVVDHYALDRRWEEALRPVCHQLMVMDDLADRAHDCDLLLDPTLGRAQADFAGLIRKEAITLLGPRYALLRPEFATLRAESLGRRKAAELWHVLVTMGGIDKDNMTGAVLDALDSSALPPEIRITAVLGRHSPWLSEVRAQAARMRLETQIRVDVADMAQLMTDSDLAIGAGGGTSWERCCLGLPAFILSLAENQHIMAKTLQDAGAVTAVESAAELAHRLDALLAAGKVAPFLARLSTASAQVTDGKGSERVCRKMRYE
jgi:UDP-2,4-diacetamido-2,4,6-trideoxy-beta-L-altropyranose hydrolase